MLPLVHRRGCPLRRYVGAGCSRTDNQSSRPVLKQRNWPIPKGGAHTLSNTKRTKRLTKTRIEKRVTI